LIGLHSGIIIRGAVELLGALGALEFLPAEAPQGGQLELEVELLPVGATAVAQAERNRIAANTIAILSISSPPRSLWSAFNSFQTLPLAR
jgi:hypothetical protein